MATVKIRGNAFQVIVCNGTKPDGKKNFVCKTFHFSSPTLTERQKQKEIDFAKLSFEADVRNGTRLQGETMTFSQFFKIWQETVNDFSSKAEYIEIIEMYFIPSIGSKKLTEIKALDLSRLYKKLAENEEKKLSRGRIEKLNAVISSLLGKAVKWELITKNVARNVEIPDVDKPGKEIRIFTPADIRRFLDMLDEPYYSFPNGKQKDLYVSPMMKTYFYLCVFSSARRAELCALKWGDIQGNSICIHRSLKKVKGGMTIKEPKTSSSSRIITIPSICCDLLDDWRNKQDTYCRSIGTAWIGDGQTDISERYIFTQENGKPMYVDTATAKFKQLISYWNQRHPDTMEQLPDIRLHDLRHTGASLLVTELDPVTVSHRLGHSKVSTTLDIYSHPQQGFDDIASDTLEKIIFCDKETEQNTDK